MWNLIRRLLGLQPPDPDLVEANRYAKNIVAELTRMGKCYVKKTKDYQTFQQVMFKPPLKVLPDRVELEVHPNLPYGIGWPELKDSKIIEGLETVCKRPVTVKHERGAGFWYIVKRTDGVKANFAYTDLRPPRGYNPEKTPLLIPIGRDDSGDQIWRNLEKIYHLLIGGATGKGKTSLLHSIVCWLIQHTHPDHAQIILIDLKEGLDFNRYNGVPHLVMPVCITPQAAYQALEFVEQEITRRGAMFRAVNAENIDTYRRRSGRFLNNIVFIFDEIANLGKLPGDQEAQAWFWFRDGSQRARALGIHFIASTQRPSVKIIDGDIKMNFTARVGLGTATDTDSRVILDNDLATGLEIGDLVYQDGSTNKGVQLRGPYITADYADQIVRAVVRHYSNEHRRAVKERELAELKRQQLIKQMLDFAVARNERRFSFEAIYAEFDDQVSADELREIAQQLEIAGVLSPAAGSRPRMVVEFVEYDLSNVRQTENDPPVPHKNGKLNGNGGPPDEQQYDE